MNIRVDVQNAMVEPCDFCIPPPRLMQKWARTALARLRRCGQLSLRIVDETEGAALNRRYRHKYRATNVLSFAFEDPPHLQTDILGDIVLCAPLIAKEASEVAREFTSACTSQSDTLRGDRTRANSFVNSHAHWAHLVVHGVLHLCGHDHEHAKEAHVMQKLETQILSELGYADPHANH